MCGYHDKEWGRPVKDDVRLFEKLCLEGFQSGLSWLTILRKRENFRAAFAGFDFETVARFGARDVKRCLADAGIVRHRGKIESVVNNAKRAGELVDRKARSQPSSGATSRPEVTAEAGRARRHRSEDTPESVALSKELTAPRLVVRRADDGPCLHAGDGAGERPPARLRLPRRSGS